MYTFINLTIHIYTRGGFDMTKEAKEKQTTEVVESSAMETTPTKYTLYGGVAICQPKNIACELIDNVVDYIINLSENGNAPKHVRMNIEFGSKTRVSWNLGVPDDYREALLTPGESKGSSLAIGTWGQGGKIAIHALGRGVTIHTKMASEDNMTEFEYANDWLWDDEWGYNSSKGRDWTVQKTVFRSEKGMQYTVIEVKEPHRDRILKTFPETDKEKKTRETKDLITALGRIYGLSFDYLKGVGTELEIFVNGVKVIPITFADEESMMKNFVYVPKFRPCKHIFVHSGLNIEVIVGCLAESASKHGGVFFYGNGRRLFASGWKDAEYLGFDTSHPQKKSWQMHVFFSGPELSIPWQMPLKEGVNQAHPLMGAIRNVIRKWLDPYVELMLATHQAERIAYSWEYRQMSMEDRKKALVMHLKTPPDSVDGFWKALPRITKEGVDCDGIRDEDVFEHEDILSEIRTRSERLSKHAAKKWFKENGVSQKSGKTAAGRIKDHEAFAAVLDPSIARSVVDEPGMEVEELLPVTEADAIQFRPSQELQERILADCGSLRGVEVKDHYFELLGLLEDLSKAPKLPKEVSVVDGFRPMLRDLVAHFGGTPNDGKND
jgi:hypothetical protein